MPKTKKKTGFSLKKFLFVLVVVILIIVALGLIQRSKNLRLQEEKRRITSQYLQHVSDKNYERAYSFKSVLYTEVNTIDDYKRHIENHPSWYEGIEKVDNYNFPGLIGRDWTSCKTFSATVHYKDGTKSSVRMKVRPNISRDSWVVIDETFALSDERRDRFKDYTKYDEAVSCKDPDRKFSK